MSAEQPEFEVGARVTFHPYERAFGVIVREVLPGYYGDERVVYRVEGMGAKSFTTGQNIEESKYYRPPTPEDLWPNQEIAVGFVLADLRDIRPRSSHANWSFSEAEFVEVATKLKIPKVQESFDKLVQDKLIAKQGGADRYVWNRPC